MMRSGRQVAQANRMGAFLGRLNPRTPDQTGLAFAVALAGLTAVGLLSIGAPSPASANGPGSYQLTVTMFGSAGAVTITPSSIPTVASAAKTPTAMGRTPGTAMNTATLTPTAVPPTKLPTVTARTKTPTPLPGASCADSCGDSPGSCWCDSSCAQYGDCCADYKAQCSTNATLTPAPVPAWDSCVGACGGPGGSCWCDSACVLYGDCCADYSAQCG